MSIQSIPLCKKITSNSYLRWTIGPFSAKTSDSCRLSAMSDVENSQVKSLARGLLILKELGAKPSGLSLADIARAVGLAPSTTHRLLNTLEGLGFVHQFDDAVWRVGVTAFEVGSSFFVARDWVHDLYPTLQLLAEAGETANLATKDGGTAVFISQVECDEVMRMVAPLGSRAPLWASGVGKALLAALEPDQVIEHLSADFGKALTARTVTSPAELQSDLANARRRGYAIDDEERNLGLRCVACPVFDENGQAVVAVSLSGPASRVTDVRLAELGEIVNRAAAKATHSLGGRWPRHWKNLVV